MSGSAGVPTRECRHYPPIWAANPHEFKAFMDNFRTFPAQFMNRFEFLGFMIRSRHDSVALRLGLAALGLAVSISGFILFNCRIYIYSRRMNQWQRWLQTALFGTG